MDEGVAGEASRPPTGCATETDIEWLDPWYHVEADEREALENELRREIAPGHELYGVPMVEIGRRKDQDAALFRREDGTNRLTVVHLTWRPGGFELPPSPSVKFYDGLEAWTQGGMGPDHNDWWSEFSLEELDD